MNIVASFERKGISGLGLVAGSLLLHAFAAMVISPLITVIAVSVLEIPPAHLKSVAEVGGFASPVAWGPGFVFGLLLSYVTRQRAACWIWLCGLIWLAAGIFDSLTSYYYGHLYLGCSAPESIVNWFFIPNSHRCASGGSALAKLVFTIPALNSAAYSIGARIVTTTSGDAFKYLKRTKRTTTLGSN